MIILHPESTGCNFKDWCDILLFGQDQEHYGDFRLDLLSGVVKEYEVWQAYYLEFLISYRQGFRATLYPEEWLKNKELKTIMPKEIEKGRGIGAWYNPEVIFLIDELSTGDRLGQSFKTEYGAYQWNLPNYCRLRPFNESQKSLKFFYKLFYDFNNEWYNKVYITPFKKNWLSSATESDQVFWTEFYYLLSLNKTRIIIQLEELFLEPVIERDDQNKIKKIKCETIKYPKFYGLWHGREWANFREQFKRLLNYVSP